MLKQGEPVVVFPDDILLQSYVFFMWALIGKS
uniref:Uncharacterized protein n=1 Tax=Nelumbo nucifera TaxID=4432 RepID=A0A822ZGJ5_NELNU|nr:TPA_asm: hypothetical protein HUJ06_001850 [Nelumbo nucifera]